MFQVDKLYKIIEFLKLLLKFLMCVKTPKEKEYQFGKSFVLKGI